MLLGPAAIMEQCWQKVVAGWQWAVNAIAASRASTSTAIALYNQRAVSKAGY